MPDQHVPLDHMPRCYSGVGPIGTLVAALLLAGLSVTFFLPSFGVTSHRADSFVWISHVVGTCLAFAAVLELLQAVLKARRRMLCRKAARERPREPWFADYSWDPQGIHDDNLRRGLRRGSGVFLIGFLLFSCSWFAFASDHGSRPLQLALGIGDVLYLTLVAVFRQSWKFGTSYLRFSQFPMRLGDEVSLRFGIDGNLRSLGRLSFRLRFAAEERVKLDKDRPAVVPFELYGEDVLPDSIDRSGREVKLRIRIPGDRPRYVTEMAKLPPRYWELEVKGNAEGGSFRGLFLLPVYLPPREVAAETPTPALSPQ